MRLPPSHLRPACNMQQSRFAASSSSWACGRLVAAACAPPAQLHVRLRHDGIGALRGWLPALDALHGSATCTGAVRLARCLATRTSSTTMVHPWSTSIIRSGVACGQRQPLPLHRAARLGEGTNHRVGIGTFSGSTGTLTGIPSQCRVPVRFVCLFVCVRTTGSCLRVKVSCCMS